MKRTLRVSLFSGIAALLLGVGVAVPASAATTTTGTTQSTTNATTDFTPSTQPLNLDSAPNITFAATTVPDTKANGSYEPTTVDNPVEVSNPGLASGWNVKVANSEFKNSDTTATAGDGTVLGGAVLTLPAGLASAANEGNPSVGPTGSSVKLDGSGTSQEVLSAGANDGLGVWDATYAPADVNLAVPAGQEPGNYTSTLTWTLGNTVQ
ncbi:WxL domain-containing protein [Levilactobacillus acidifarinae]|uniref:WxL domain-containing protein n=1 Tax=Levilactobacillus acidifarinae TaxID=267364 RepID=UPI000ADD8466|nr:WxL domain-containing protein [Levilactobacillus acidifarinae]GEO69489.1 cell surface protein [Levilactobacillus acidifarinae]